MHYTRGQQAALVKLGIFSPWQVGSTLGGAALGAGTGYLKTTNPENKTRNALIGGAIGGALGYGGGTLVNNWNNAENAKIDKMVDQIAAQHAASYGELDLDKIISDTVAKFKNVDVNDDAALASVLGAPPQIHK